MFCIFHHKNVLDLQKQFNHVLGFYILHFPSHIGVLDFTFPSQGYIDNINNKLTKCKGLDYSFNSYCNHAMPN